MTVRAKMQLTSETKSAWGGKTLRFSAMYDPSIPEDQRFMKATPTGHIDMQVDNEAALTQFELGKYYYIDFSPVPVSSESNAG